MLVMVARLARAPAPSAAALAVRVTTVRRHSRLLDKSPCGL